MSNNILVDVFYEKNKFFSVNVYIFSSKQIYKALEKVTDSSGTLWFNDTEIPSDDRMLDEFNLDYEGIKLVWKPNLC